MSLRQRVWSVLPISALMYLAATPIPLYSQQPGLSSAQQGAYTRLRLSIETTGQGFGTVGAAGTISAQTWTKWQAYEGFNKISESEFFRRVNLPQQAQQAEMYREHGAQMRLWGFGGMALGLVMVIAGGTGSNTGVMVAGLGFTCAGMAFGVTGVLRSRSNRFPFATVDELVGPYNSDLRQRILRGEVQ